MANEPNIRVQDGGDLMIGRVEWINSTLTEVIAAECYAPAPERVILYGGLCIFVGMIIMWIIRR